MKLLTILLITLLTFTPVSVLGASEVANAGAVLDALADTKGKILDNPTKLRIAERFIDREGDSSLTNEQKAAIFNDMLIALIQNNLGAHVAGDVREANESTAQAAGQAAADEL